MGTTVLWSLTWWNDEMPFNQQKTINQFYPLDTYSHTYSRKIAQNIPLSTFTAEVVHFYRRSRSLKSAAITTSRYTIEWSFPSTLTFAMASFQMA